MTGSSVRRSGIDTYFKTCAPNGRRSVLFTIQWDDERFDRLGAKDKRVHADPGLHVDKGPEAFEVQAECLKRCL